MSDVQSNEHEELSNEPGLSSAMHDIRMIARSYQVESEKRASSPKIDLGGVSMNPDFLLVPKSPSRSEGWKSLALVMMVLLGLSTSALALSLYAGIDEAGAKSAPRELQFDTSSLRATPPPTPDIVVAPEPAIYSVSTAKGVTAQPERREVVAPTSTKSSMRKSSTVSVRAQAEPANSCDEVACLLDSSDPCCQAFESVSGQQSVLDEAPSRPYRPTRTEIMAPMSSIQGRVATCSSKFDYQGVASVKVVIAPSGSVSSVELDDGSEAFQSCVESHVAKLEFPELSQPFTFSYPFTL